MNGNRVQPRPHISHQNPSLGSFRGLAEVNKIHDSHLILLHKVVSGEAGDGFPGPFSVNWIVSMPSGIDVELDQDYRLLTRTSHNSKKPEHSPSKPVGGLHSYRQIQCIYKLAMPMREHSTYYTHRPQQLAENACSYQRIEADCRHGSASKRAPDQTVHLCGWAKTTCKYQRTEVSFKNGHAHERAYDQTRHL